MPNPSQEHPVSSKTPNEDLEDIDVLCTFKIKTENRNLEHEYAKDQWLYPSQEPQASSKDQNANPTQKPPVSSKTPNEDLKDMIFFASSKSS